MSNKYKFKHKVSPKDTTKETKKFPKILIFDLETSPMISYTWGRWNQNISLDQSIQESFLLCWSAKWLFEDRVFGDVVTPEEAKKADDSRIIKSLYQAISEADILVAYNGKKFDIPYMNTKFFTYGFPPYTTRLFVDPIETAKQSFRFSSNKMDHIATELGLQNKISTDFNLWKGCMEGKQESLDYMFKYNKQDIIVLEEIYLRMLPYIKNHPNINSLLSSTASICSKCGSHSLREIKDKFYFTPTGKYKLFRCYDCGTIIRGRENLNKSIVKVI